MQVVSTREFRANQAKYFGAAHRGEDVIIKARLGNFRIVPVSEDDVLVNKNDLAEHLRRSLKEVKGVLEGRGKLMRWEDMMNDLDD